VIFKRFSAAVHTSRVNTTKWLEIDQGNFNLRTAIDMSFCACRDQKLNFLSFLGRPSNYKLKGLACVFLDKMKIIALGWSWKSVRAIVAKRYVVSQKRWEIRPKFLLSINRKSNKHFHMTRKSFAGFPTPVYSRPSLATAKCLVITVTEYIIIEIRLTLNSLIHRLTYQTRRDNRPV